MGPYINLTFEDSRENWKKYKMSNYIMMIEKLKNYIINFYKLN